jgi:S1-C subfamily serine protease
MTRLTCFVVTACLALSGRVFCQAAEPKDLIGVDKLPADATLVDDLAHLMRTAHRAGAVREGDWSPTGERSRGIGAEVYGKAAPAVVLVRTSLGHGTGFLIRENWLLTNRHVVEDADYSSELGGQVVYVSLGRTGDDGWMERIEEPRRGLVYRTSLQRDLALVKLVDPPSEPLEVDPVKLADKPPGPNTACVAIGHPARGTLWTSRTGELVGAGTFPDDQIENLTRMLSVSARDRAIIEKNFKASPVRRRVVLSDCGLNPGDSGGPLFDARARLIAVSFAVPSVAGGVGVGNFSFHIHLDEVKEFLANWPKQPRVDPPNPLPQGAYKKFADRDGDGFADALIFGFRPDSQPTGITLDLDGDSYGGLSMKESEKPKRDLFFADWDCEFALSVVPRLRYSYDTDNDGRFDLSFSDENMDGELDTELRWMNDRWRVIAEKSPEVGPGVFRDSVLNKRFEELSPKG